MKKNVQAIVLCSGGLDSLLACAILIRQGVAVTALHFDMGLGAAVLARRFGIDVSPHPVGARVALLGAVFRPVPLAPDYLPVLLHPPHGYGSAMNPCIDCHAYMFRTAKHIMDSEGFDFVATGEVIGQRPMSQMRDKLDIVARDSLLGDKLLRPLSAKLLQPTAPERDGIIDRNALYDIEGRARDRQMALAEEFGLTDYPTPAGGCLLTDEPFARRLKEYIAHTPEEAISLDDVSLLSFGRHFRIGKAKLVIGRNALENSVLEHFAKGRVLLTPEYRRGPSGVLCGEGMAEGSTIRDALSVIAFYSKEERTELPITVRVGDTMTSMSLSQEDSERGRSFANING
ncbi:MAG: hypothetical protein AABZ39_08275 [Spirochaetota bacterium]